MTENPKLWLCHDKAGRVWRLAINSVLDGTWLLSVERAKRPGALSYTWDSESDARDAAETIIHSQELKIMEIQNAA